MTSKINETKCPLCGKDNNCLNVLCRSKKHGEEPENKCWCNSGNITFPSGLTNQVPIYMQRKACICQSCAETYKVSVTE